MRKRILSLLLVFTMVFSLVPPAALAATDTQESSVNPANLFTDVKQTDWFYDAMQYARVNGFFEGTSAVTFEPDGTMTRGMFVTVLGRMAGVAPDNYTGETEFTDVPQTMYYAPYVQWAAQYGITGGTGEGRFSPDALINREQMAVFFVRYFEWFDVEYAKDAAITTTPADIDSVSPYARDAVLKLWKTGLLNGGGVNFNPAGNAGRAQAATLCMRTDEAVETWYKEPGTPSERVSIDPATGETATPENPTKPSGGSSGGGTSRTTYYEVKFASGNDQTAISLPESRTVASGTAISTLPTPSRNGVVFLGWYYDDALTEAVESGDTVTKNITLYAKTAAGEEVQSIETPNYVTKEIDAGKFTFDVTGVTLTDANKADVLKFINITGGNMDVDYSVSGTKVSATLEAGQTYKIELMDDSAGFKLDGEEQSKSIRILNILTKKEEVKNAELNKNIKQLAATEIVLPDTVFEGLYKIDETAAATVNESEGTFTYTGNTEITTGDTLAVTKGVTDLTDVDSTEGQVAYLKITSVNGDAYGYEMADVDDVLFVPDLLPIESDWDTDASNTTVTISAENLAKAMGNVEADSLDEGDYFALLKANVTYENSLADDQISAYGVITAYEINSAGNYIITYTGTDQAAIESALDVYYEQDKDIDVSDEEEAQIIAEIKDEIENSDYTGQAAAYVMAVMLESDGLDTAPDPAAVAQTTEGISTYAMGNGLVLYDNDKKAKVSIDRRNFKINIDTTAEHLNGNGFDVSVSVPITLEMGDVTIEFTAEFEEDVILSQRISTNRHRIGFLRYDYSLNASFDIGNYTGIHFTANIQTDDGEDENLSEQLEGILNDIEDYTKVGSDIDGTMESLSGIYQEVMESMLRTLRCKLDHQRRRCEGYGLGQQRREQLRLCHQHL